jgi:hypothetical protein
MKDLVSELQIVLVLAHFDEARNPTACCPHPT